MKFRLFKGKPSDTYTLIAIDVVVIGAVLAMCTPVKAQEDPRKEWVRLSYTEFCRVVKEPPAAPIAALAEHDKRWAPFAAWVGNIVQMRKERCGDA